MYPEDRVLVVYVPQRSDFELIQQQGWYRIPQKNAPKGIHAEYYAFYFGRNFRQEKWAIHYYARNLGHELATRRTLFPQDIDHPRSENIYYKVQLGEIRRCVPPIVSLRWRRITFIHTTWDRFQDAREINDLFVEGDPYVDRLYATLKERGIQPERNYRVSESGTEYLLPMVVPCETGMLNVSIERLPDEYSDLETVVQNILKSAENKGGVSSRRFQYAED